MALVRGHRVLHPVGFAHRRVVVANALDLDNVFRVGRLVHNNDGRMLAQAAWDFHVDKVGKRFQMRPRKAVVDELGPHDAVGIAFFILDSFIQRVFFFALGGEAHGCQKKKSPKAVRVIRKKYAAPRAAQTFTRFFIFYSPMNIVVLETFENATVVFIYALFCLHVAAVVALVSINALPRDTFVY